MLKLLFKLYNSNTQDNSQAAVSKLNQADNLWFLFTTVQKVMSSTRWGKYPVQSPDKHQIILKSLYFQLQKLLQSSLD